MTQTDFDGFVVEFSRLSSALERYKRTPGESAAKADAYFHVLKPFPLSLVIAKADTWLKTESKFPTPAQWAGTIVRKAVELPILTDSQAREQIRAEGLFYEDLPCRCAPCLEAGVNEKPLRFVPMEDASGAVVRAKIGERVVVTGRWIHGWELFRWYDARANFYNHCVELGFRGDVLKPKKERQNFMQRMAAIFSPKVEQP